MMLHIATAHFRHSHWIPIQARELQRNIRIPVVTWGSLEDVDSAYARYFDRALIHEGRHEEKLNWLAAEIVATAADDDWLMFLDGDAFPIDDPVPLISSGLNDASLVAVRREENDGEPQPHPCFCVTTVATWRDLPGDWGKGFTWAGPDGEPVTDVGAQLLHRLEATGTRWTEVLRSNRNDLHPVFFAVYGDAIYHHGAGFRWPLSRVDIARLGRESSPRHTATKETIRRNLQQSQELFSRIELDDPAWLSELV